MAKYPEPEWIDGYTEDLRRVIAALVPPECVDREMVRILSWVIEQPCKMPRPTSHQATHFTDPATTKFSDARNRSRSSEGLS